LYHLLYLLTLFYLKNVKTASSCRWWLMRVGTNRPVCWKHCTLCCVMAGWRCRRPEPTTYDGDVAKGFLLFYYYYFSFCVDLCTVKSHQSDLSNSKRRRYLFTYKSFFLLSRLTHKQARRIVFARCLSSPAIILTSRSSC